MMILLAILCIGDDAYGVLIAREIEATGRRTVAIAAVYAALERLDERGLRSQARARGRAKKFFQVTGAGVRLVREAHEALTAMRRGLSVLKGRA